MYKRQKVARHGLALARAALSAVQGTGTGQLAGGFALQAPVAGRVLKLHHSSETTVPLGAAWIESGDTRQLEVVAEQMCIRDSFTPGGSAGCVCSAPISSIRVCLLYTSIGGLRVATYNIHKGVRGVGPRKRLEIHNLGLAVEALDADLVFLQEVDVYKRQPWAWWGLRCPPKPLLPSPETDRAGAARQPASPSTGPRTTRRVAPRSATPARFLFQQDRFPFGVKP